MARIKDVVDECLLIATAFSDISSSTYNEQGAVNFEDNDKIYPHFLFDKRSVTIAVNKFAHASSLPSKSTYTQTIYFQDLYNEGEKVSTDLQTKQDALQLIAERYIAELRNRNESGRNGFYIGGVTYNITDETHNDRLVEIGATVEIIVMVESCTTGSFTYAGVEQPTNLVKTSNTDTSISIGWVDNATAETNYEVWRSLDCVSWTLLATIAANSVSYTDSGLANETPYAYKVRAITSTDNGEFSNIIMACTDSSLVVCLDATDTIKDSAGTILYTNVIASGGTNNQTIVDSVVFNSGFPASYTQNILAQGSLQLPDITHTDSDLSPITLPAQTPMVCTPATTQSGIAYDRPEITGQTTSYRTGDDADNLSNGVYDYTPPAYPTSYAKLDYSTPSTAWKTLVSNNAFGNKDRFTDDTGGQTYTNPYVIDHLTGLGIYTPMQGANQNWNTNIDEAQASTLLGYSDWRMANLNEALATTNFSEAAMSTAPFSFASSPSVVQTSTTQHNNTSNYMRLVRTAYPTVAAEAKTTAAAARAYLLVRTHYT